MAKKLAGKIDKTQIEKILSDSRVALYPELLKKLEKKKGKRFSYFSPEFKLFNADSVSRGKNVLKSQQKIFNEIEKKYGVKKEALVAIFRIETDLGGNVGEYRVFNVLLTFSVLKNRRSEWAKKELTSLFLLCSENQWDILEIRGSWAGAFGLCQFIPSSFMVFAKDGNGDNKRDLFSFEDAIASIANYLNQHGWKNDDIEKKKRAVYAYNHSDEYVKAVLAYAEVIK